MTTAEMSREGVALIAHEIGSAVSVLAGYAAMVADGSLDDRPELRAQVAEKVIQQGANVRALTDALLGSLTTEDEPTTIDLRKVARLAVKRAGERPGIEACLVGVDMDEKAEPLPVRGNQTQVLCILTCLLTNGLLYSPHPASVTLEVRDADPAEVAVSDHGFGIPESVRLDVFEWEKRLDESRGGFGIGLALSREMAKRNGGSLRLESSEVGKGSTFVLALPRAAAPEGEE